MQKVIEGLRKKLYRAQDELKHAKGKKLKKNLELLINDLRHDIGYLLFTCGEYEKGLAMYQGLSWKTHGEGKYHGICWGLIQMRYYDAAWKLLNKGLKRYPESPCLLNAMGVLHRDLYHDYEALQYFEKALHRNPKNYSILFNKANVLCDFNFYEESASIYRQCIKNNPYDPYNFVMLGHCHLETGYPEEAVGSFKRARDLWDVPEAFNGLYRAYEDMGLSNEARLIAEEGLRKFPDKDSRLYLNLANAYHNRGWVDDAKEVLQRGLKKFPDDEDLSELLKKIEDDSDDPKKGSNLPILLAIILNNIRDYRK
jgi:tetratricopeptide (TPR) repeat protein